MSRFIVKFSDRALVGAVTEGLVFDDNGFLTIVRWSVLSPVKPLQLIVSLPRAPGLQSHGLIRFIFILF